MKRFTSWFSVIVMLAAGQLASAAETPLDPQDATLPRLQMPAEFASATPLGSWHKDFGVFRIPGGRRSRIDCADMMTQMTT